MGVLILKIGGRTIPVTWEENESTAELKRQAAKGNITILFKGDESLIGTFQNVKVTKALTWILNGELI